ncbi:hypothetical protein SELMODRAFT_408624 [Selaginella moellendorffii]|uniref:Uncharacterized protein VND2-2 n=2 Tax=Selaginella moellendorffii TaxID=88036 RepID=D8R8W2_SELML|nr:hypothetical protein SELMODRAFT_408624 [Selaginella moellendorffii]
MSSSIQLSGTSSVPPGFRFHPTDEELVGYYLAKKVAASKIDLDVIREIDLYKLEPWDLQERCRIGSAEQHEWYFFSHKDKKYPTGTRTNRATGAGFWKATGRDKPIFARVSKLIGMRKTLVFYKGRAPNGQKSDWIMHEYRLEDDINNTATNEEGWVVCRVFRKRNVVKKPSSDFDGACCYDPEENMDKMYSSNSSFVKQELESAGIYFPFAFDHSLPHLESPKRASPMSYNPPPEDHEHHHDLIKASSYIDNELEELVHKTFSGGGTQAPAETSFHGFSDEMVPPSWEDPERMLSSQVAGVHEDEFSKESRLGNLDSLVERMNRGQQLQQPDYSYDVDLWGFTRYLPIQFAGFCYALLSVSLPSVVSWISERAWK